MAALEAAMTSVPRLLMADWMMMFAMAKTALCTPAGRPIFTMPASAARSSLRSLGFTRTAVSVLSKR